MVFFAAVALCTVTLVALLLFTDRSSRARNVRRVSPLRARPGAAQLNVVIALLAGATAISLATQVTPRPTSREFAPVIAPALANNPANLAAPARVHIPTSSRALRMSPPVPLVRESNAVTGGMSAPLPPVYSMAVAPLFASATTQSGSSGTATRTRTRSPTHPRTRAWARCCVRPPGSAAVSRSSHRSCHPFLL